MLVAMGLVVTAIVAATIALTLVFHYRKGSPSSATDESSTRQLGRSLSATYRYAAVSSDAELCSEIAT